MQGVLWVSATKSFPGEWTRVRAIEIKANLAYSGSYFVYIAEEHIHKHDIFAIFLLFSNFLRRKRFGIFCFVFHKYLNLERPFG